VSEGFAVPVRTAILLSIAWLLACLGVYITDGWADTDVGGGLMTYVHVDVIMYREGGGGGEGSVCSLHQFVIGCPVFVLLLVDGYGRSVSQSVNHTQGDVIRFG